MNLLILGSVAVASGLVAAAPLAVASSLRLELDRPSAVVRPLQPKKLKGVRS